MLEVLSLQDNQLSGVVPQALYNMSRLQVMALRRSGNLTGMFPTNRSFNLPMLQFISLAENNFAGRFTSGLASCQHLRTIGLFENSFMDVVPSWVAKLPQLQYLGLSSNNLIGSIPSVLSNLTTLVSLELAFGNLSGEIPLELGLIQELSHLDLGSNQLTRQIPPSIGNLSKLSILSFDNNQLSGQVPTTLGKNASLNQVNLSENNLEGNLDFSSALSKSGQLQELLIQENSFTGLLFGLMGNLTSRLNIFVAHDNKLIGGLPKTIANISSLFFFCEGNKT